MAVPLKAVARKALDFPSVEEELNRKAFGELERLVRHRDQGKITPAQFSVAVNTLFHATSGLVSRELFDLISTVREEPAPQWVERHVFMHLLTARFVHVERGLDSVRVSMTKWKEHPRGWQAQVQDKSFKDELIPSKTARDYVERLRGTLESQDYLELT